jgi:hypothetical protein
MVSVRGLIMGILSQRHLAGASTEARLAPPRAAGRGATGEARKKHHSRGEARDPHPLGAYGLRLGPIRWRLWLRWIF